MADKDYYKKLLKIKLPQLLFPLILVLLLMYGIMAFTLDTDISFGTVIQYIVKGDPIFVIYWYMLLIPVFYVVFAAIVFLFHSQRKTVVCMSLFTLVFIFLGNHFDYGQWWYNTCHLFTIGLVWAAFEDKICSCLKKSYWVCFIGFGFIFLFVWQYFDQIYALWPVPEMRLIISLVRNAAFTLAFVLMMLKLKLGNPILDRLGSVSLELYLLHPVFLLLFRSSLIYIGNDLFFCISVIAATVISAFLLSPLYNLLCRKYAKLFA